MCTTADEIRRAKKQNRVCALMGIEGGYAIEPGNVAANVAMVCQTGVAGISIEEARRAMQRQHQTIMGFPEVALVHGKAGRAETATDPAPTWITNTLGPILNMYLGLPNGAQTVMMAFGATAARGSEREHVMRFEDCAVNGAARAAGP